MVNLKAQPAAGIVLDALRCKYGHFGESDWRFVGSEMLITSGSAIDRERYSSEAYLNYSNSYSPVEPLLFHSEILRIS